MFYFHFCVTLKKLPVSHCIPLLYICLPKKSNIHFASKHGMVAQSPWMGFNKIIYVGLAMASTMAHYLFIGNLRLINVFPIDPFYFYFVLILLIPSVPGAIPHCSLFPVRRGDLVRGELVVGTPEHLTDLVVIDVQYGTAPDNIFTLKNQWLLDITDTLESKFAIVKNWNLVAANK